MSGLKVERPGHLDLSRKRVSFDERSHGTHTPPLTPSPKKMKLEPEIRPRRRRTHSCSVLGDRKRRQVVVIPTKFLLGGNITDPLNLEACGKGGGYRRELEAVNRGGETVKVIIPPNINDPLNLDACSEDGEEQLADAIYRQRRRRKGRKRRRRNSEPTSGAVQVSSDTNKSASVDENLCKIGSQISPPLEALGVEKKKPVVALRQISCPADLDTNECSQTAAVTAAAATHSKCNRRRPTKADRSDRIVSPVVKQPGAQLWHYPPANESGQEEGALQAPKFYHPRNALYQYGNYNQYYGYRNPDRGEDPRLKYFRARWFEDKDVLDIGCNIGHISFVVARDFGARHVTGIDIDKKLVEVANKNYRHYLPDGAAQEARFPKSMRTMYGRLKPVGGTGGVPGFPYNVRFFQNNYVLEADQLLDTIKEEFDCVLCLSVTKWIHLNFGDAGLRRFFSRIYRNLRPDGFLILEPQAWPSYKKKRKLTEKIFETYKTITFFPNQFDEFLTKELGLFHVHTFRVDHTLSKGFHRVLSVYRKPTDAERKVTPKTCTLDKSSQTEDYSGAPIPSPQPRYPTPDRNPVEEEDSRSSNSSTIENNNVDNRPPSSPGCRRQQSPGIECQAGPAPAAVLAPTPPPPALVVVMVGEHSSNSPTVGSTTDNLPRPLTPCPEEASNCDSTTDEAEQSTHAQSPPVGSSPVSSPPGEKS